LPVLKVYIQIAHLAGLLKRLGIAAFKGFGAVAGQLKKY